MRERRLRYEEDDDAEGGDRVTGTVLLSRLSTLSARWVVVVFAVPAVLIGLVAMHSLTSGGMNETAITTLPSASVGHHTSSTVPLADMVAMAPSHDAPAPGGDCGGPCMPSHDMLGMLCVLALLVTVIVFAMRLLLGALPALRSVLGTLHRKAVALAPPSPPSLHVLSISRT